MSIKNSISLIKQNATNSKILVVGDVMLDEYLFCTANRISPEAPVPVTKIKSREFRAGGAANVAVNISNLGAQTTLIGVVGIDKNAGLIETILKERNVNYELIIDETVSTICKTRVISEGQQMIRIDQEDILSQDTAEKLANKVIQIIKDFDLIVISDYAKGSLKQIQTIFKFANEYNKKIIVDPKDKDYTKYFGAYLITPNKYEFEAVIDKCLTKDTLKDEMFNTSQKYKIKNILVTLGAEGMAVYRDTNRFYKLNSEAKEVYDVSGAGDTVIASVSVGCACGLELDQAIILSNYAAGLVVSKVGTHPIKLDDLEEIYHKKVKMIQISDALKIFESYKKRGLKIVATNGCFDILHVGHIDYLEKAKALGDVLFVLVNSDKSVKKLKGPSRPINSAELRVKMLCAIEAVDFVMVFKDDTPEKIYSTLLPDVLVKGGDYNVSNIAGSGYIIANGGEVHTIDFIHDISTSKLLQMENIK